MDLIYHNYKEQGPFRLEYCGDIALLRRVMENNGFVQSSLSETTAIGNPANPLASFVELAAVSKKTTEPSPFNTLVLLFVLAQSISEDAAQVALDPVELDQLLTIGGFACSNVSSRAVAAFLPFEGLLLALDILRGGYLHDYVLDVGLATLFLANLTVRQQVEAALDLDTGAGFQAILASSHAARVIATDTNPRDLNFTMFNALLNDVSNIELRQGSLYDPVADYNFDLVVSNPTFVIFPKFQYEYRDSGMPGDAISEQVIRGVFGNVA